jgi:hypothetical protein
MPIKNLSAAAKVTTALDYASANADRTGAILDMKGFEGVMMVVKFATIAGGAATSIKAQQDDAVGGGTMADLEGTAQTVADNDDDQIFIIDLVKPRKRYVRLYIDKDGANATAESAIYIQYGAREEPVVQTVTNAVTYERHVSPAEGTA